METLRLALLQFDPAFEDRAFARSRIDALVAGLTCDLLVLPEMTLTGFTMSSSTASLGEDDLEWFAALARRIGCGVVFGGVEDGRNVAVLLDRRGERIGTYAKRHLFGLGGETEAYRPGATATTWDFEGWKILPAICYDLRFSYHFWDAANGHDLVVVPANWPASRREHWRTLLRARAIENQIVVAGCNRLGADPLARYGGDSLVVDAQGRILSDAADVEGIVLAEVDRSQTARTRERFPFLGDRLR